MFKTEKLKVAQIGTSRYSHGCFAFESLKSQSDIFEIIGYALPENEREKVPDRINVFDGYTELTVDEILNNPEITAVFIETEEIYLTKYALMAAEKGKHIHMEKPGGLDLAEFEKLIDTVKANGTVFHTGYMYRYNPVIKQLLKEIKEGQFGDIISVEAQMSAPYTIEQRVWLNTFPGGMMFFLGCHLIDLILQIQGIPNEIIPLNKSTCKEGVYSADFGMAAFEYDDGVSFVKTNASELGGYMRRQLVVTGTKKTVEIKPLEINMGNDDVCTDMICYTSDNWHDEGIKTKSAVFNRYNDMTASFAGMVRGEVTNSNSYDYELELYKTILKCCKTIV